MSAKKKQPRGKNGRFMSPSAAAPAGAVPEAESVAKVLGVSVDAYKGMAAAVEAETGLSGWTVMEPFVQWYGHMVDASVVDKPDVDWEAYAAELASALEAKAKAGGDTDGKRAALQSVFGGKKPKVKVETSGDGGAAAVAAAAQALADAIKGSPGK